MNPIPLLLVEDDAISRGFLSAALRAMPATVVDVACDGAQAAALVRETAHALWLLDANLPDTSGEALLATLRTLRSGISAVCLTADPTPERAINLRAAGFAEIATKPLTIPALQSIVRRALGNPRNASGLLVWDDAQALTALGGNAAAVTAMRQLFAAELPSQVAAIVAAIDTLDYAKAHAILHRLKASCGFVGCPRLLASVHALAAAVDDPVALRGFREQAAVAQAQP
ncbi:MAG: response regulator [Proteobacteria bacterium]|nr:response regulator [Pseudomonadota bacterium]